ncbi:hypothetical protein [Microbispora bryophytorum]
MIALPATTSRVMGSAHRGGRCDAEHAVRGVGDLPPSLVTTPAGGPP